MWDESIILRFRHFRENDELVVAIFTEDNAVLSSKGLSRTRSTVIDAALIVGAAMTK